MASKASNDSLARGRKTFEEVTGANPDGMLAAFADVSPDLPKFVLSFAFGELYERPALAPAQRQIVTIGMLAAMGGCEPQLRAHISSALTVGVTPAEIVEVVLHAISYAGFARAINAMVIVKEIFAQNDLLPVS